MISLIDRKNAKLANEDSPVESESVPIVYAFYGGMALNMRPP